MLKQVATITKQPARGPNSPATMLATRMNQRIHYDERREWFLRLSGDDLDPRSGLTKLTFSNSTSPRTSSRMSPPVLSESIFGTLFITSIMCSPAVLAFEKYFTFDKLAPVTCFLAHHSWQQQHHARASRHHHEATYPFGFGFFLNRGIKVAWNCKNATAPLYASVPCEPRPIRRGKNAILH